MGKSIQKMRLEPMNCVMKSNSNALNQNKNAFLKKYSQNISFEIIFVLFIKRTKKKLYLHFRFEYFLLVLFSLLYVFVMCLLCINNRMNEIANERQQQQQDTKNRKNAAKKQNKNGKIISQ